MKNNILEIAKNAKNAFLTTMNLDISVKNEALKKIAKNLEKNKNKIFEANNLDLKEAEILLKNNKINTSTYNRLKLDENKFKDMIKGIYDLIELDDPVNQIIWQKELDSDLILKKISTPIGLIGVIFEARPDCLVQISSLVIKSGNCAILKGGSESINTNKTIFEFIETALNNTEGFEKNVLNLIFSRDDVKKMLEADEYINLIIPRGSNALVKYIKENTKIPVLGHASGICHIFVDESADFENTTKIIIDAKTQYPSACNAVETLLIHKNYPYIDELKKTLKNKEIKLIENPENYSTEYGDKILSVKIVNNIEEAIKHINKYGSGHTDSILSKDDKNIEKFMKYIDSSSVFANCSTRFSDGFRYGFGAEVGISTNKTHARGPVGLEGLTIYKYELFGKNNIVNDYTSGKKTFEHKFI